MNDLRRLRNEREDELREVRAAIKSRQTIFKKPKSGTDKEKLDEMKASTKVLEATIENKRTEEGTLLEALRLINKGRLYLTDNYWFVLHRSANTAHMTDPRLRQNLEATLQSRDVEVAKRQDRNRKEVCPFPYVCGETYCYVYHHM